MLDRNESPVNEELVSLANRMCDKTITDEERDRLEEILEQNEHLRRPYLDYLRVHAALVWRY